MKDTNDTHFVKYPIGYAYCMPVLNRTKYFYTKKSVDRSWIQKLNEKRRALGYSFKISHTSA